jgi:hypothetical protein
VAGDSLVEYVRAFVRQVEAELLPKLDSPLRFPSVTAVSARFKACAETALGKTPCDTSAINETTNELHVIEKILAASNVALIEYEPPPVNPGGKTIDLRVTLTDGQVIYVDIKTIAPRTDIDKWQKYVAAREGGFFSPTAALILGEEQLGGTIYHQFVAARGKMLDYVVELEAKATGYDFSKRPTLAMTFCGRPFDWDITQLEDFVQYYHSGKHRDDDPFGAMEDHSIREKRIALKRSIDLFYYLQREKVEPLDSRLFLFRK